MIYLKTLIAYQDMIAMNSYMARHPEKNYLHWYGSYTSMISLPTCYYLLNVYIV